MLDLDAIPVDGPGVEARGRPRLEPSESEPQFPEIGREGSGCGITDTAACLLLASAMHHAAEECARREDDRRRADLRTIPKSDPGDPRVPETEACDLSLDEGESRSGGEQCSHRPRVAIDVHLGPTRLDREALACIQASELDGRRIGDTGHCAAQGVNLTD